MKDPASARVSEAYSRALKAHATAQARYDLLKAEIQSLRAENHTAKMAPHQSKYSTEVHLTSLKRREQLRKLQIIEQALTDVGQVQRQDSAKTPFVAVDLVFSDASTPHPPARSNYDADHRVGLRLAELKKTILAKKREADQSLAINLAPPLIAKTARSPTSEVAGLRRALDMLTAWMEGQLSTAGGAESRHQGLSESSVVEHEPAPQPATMAEIKALYEQYLAARRRLVGTLNNRVRLSEQGTEEIPAANACNETSRGQSDTNASHTLLPFLATLASTKQEEQALLLQSAYARRQVSSAESESSRLLARLADESHLVHSGSTRGSDWAEAASEAAQSTAKYVGQRLRAGEQAVARGMQTLNDVESLRQVLVALKARA